MCFSLWDRQVINAPNACACVSNKQQVFHAGSTYTLKSPTFPPRFATLTFWKRLCVPVILESVLSGVTASGAVCPRLFILTKLFILTCCHPSQTLGNKISTLITFLILLLECYYHFLWTNKVSVYVHCFSWKHLVDIHEVWQMCWLYLLPPKTFWSWFFIEVWNLQWVYPCLGADIFLFVLVGTLLHLFANYHNTCGTVE